MTPDYHTRQHYESPLEKSPRVRSWLTARNLIDAALMLAIAVMLWLLFDLLASAL